MTESQRPADGESCKFIWQKSTAHTYVGASVADYGALDPRSLGRLLCLDGSTHFIVADYVVKGQEVGLRLLKVRVH